MIIIIHTEKSVLVEIYKTDDLEIVSKMKKIRDEESNMDNDYLLFDLDEIASWETKQKVESKDTNMHPNKKKGFKKCICCHSWIYPDKVPEMNGQTCSNCKKCKSLGICRLAG